MYGNHFFHDTIRRYVATFGTHFNDIRISRTSNDTLTTQEFAVPLAYAPWQKTLARAAKDPDFKSQAMTLPRMSFELMNVTYDSERKLSRVTDMMRHPETFKREAENVYSFAPYNLEFNLYIMVKNSQDGTKIVEQILPFFQPDVCPSVLIIDALDLYMDVPIVLNSVTMDDSYEGDFETRRAIIWTLSFTMKGFFFGPRRTRKKIKFISVNMHTKLDSDAPNETINVQPGLTANGEPTTDIALTIPYENIEEDDPWDYIVTIQDDN